MPSICQGSFCLFQLHEPEFYLLTSTVYVHSSRKVRKNTGTALKTLGLKNFSFPKVHPNILGPGLAQVNHCKYACDSKIFPGYDYDDSYDL